MEVIFILAWDCLLGFLGLLNQAIGWLLDIKFLGVPFLVYLVFVDLLNHLISFFSKDYVLSDDDEGGPRDD